jgi:putative heme-binding domain-containing protein
MALAEDRPLEHRLLAIDVLTRLDPSAGETLVALLDARHPQELQSAAAAALATADAATATTMLQTWPQTTTTTRRALVSAALRSTTSTAALVTAIEQGDVLANELDANTRDALRAVPDAALALRIQRMLGAEPASDRAAVVAKFTPALALDGDRIRGAALFEKHCLACHNVQGRGHRVGPDLSGVSARPAEALLIDLLDPNRQVTPNFVTYTAITQQGQVLSGLIASETASGVTLRRAEGAQDFVLRDQIDQLRATGKSLMPEGIEQSLTAQDIADLLDFLARPDARLFSLGN